MLGSAMAGQKMARVVDACYAAAGFNSHAALFEEALSTPCPFNRLAIGLLHRWVRFDLLFEPTFPYIEIVSGHESAIFDKAPGAVAMND